MGTRPTLVTIITVIGLSMISLTGCVSLGGGASETNTGAGVAIVPGAGLSLLEPLQGGLIGRVDPLRINRADRIAALQSEYRALEFTPPGDIVTWQGRNGTLSGQVVPSQPYRVGSQDCRQYTHTVASGSATPTIVRGTACRNPDGSWSLLS